MCIDKRSGSLSVRDSLPDICFPLLFLGHWQCPSSHVVALHNVGNHKFVIEKFPIGERLYEPPEDEDEGSEAQETVAKKEPKKFGDQLDWWQKIGRWM